jgi:hypothetical protein
VPIREQQVMLGGVSRPTTQPCRRDTGAGRNYFAWGAWFYAPVMLAGWQNGSEGDGSQDGANGQQGGSQDGSNGQQQVGSNG